MSLSRVSDLSRQKDSCKTKSNSHKKAKKKNIVDLTAEENEEESTMEEMSSNIIPSHKRMRQRQRKTRGIII
jgi:hypothetical protein